MELKKRAALFSALGDPVRLNLLAALYQNGEFCGKELSQKLGISVALVSHHVKILEDAGLILRRKDGQFSRFTVDESTIRQALDLCSLFKGIPHPETEESPAP